MPKIPPYFTPNGDKYIDEDGLELTLTVIDSDEGQYCIEDKQGNQSFFDEAGRLIKLKNNKKHPGHIAVAYQDASNLITSIVDGAGRTYNFTYENELLVEISYVGKGPQEVVYVTFGYMLKQPNCPFVLYVGTRKLVKRKEFEEYISGKLII